MYKTRRRIKQSNVLVMSDRPDAIQVAFKSIMRNREALETYIKNHCAFELALDPLTVDFDAPRVVQLAAGAAEIAGVGPMAQFPSSCRTRC